MYIPGREEALDTLASAPAESPAAATPCVVNSATEAWLSPSIDRPERGQTPAFELKFLVSERLAGNVQAWVANRMQLDSYGDPEQGGAYHTTTLYLDTPHLDVFHRSPGHRRRKLRVRRYGGEERIYLECKERRGDRVRKWRSDVPLTELDVLAAETCPGGWGGGWFHERMWAGAFRPACRMSYERTAFVQLADEGPLRLTLDRQIRGEVTTGWELPPQVEGVRILPEHVICELKFRGGMPTLFKQLIEALQLETGSVSKYHRMMVATGTVPGA
jgi:hypothetical protein